VHRPAEHLSLIERPGCASEFEFVQSSGDGRSKLVWRGERGCYHAPLPGAYLGNKSVLIGFAGDTRLREGKDGPRALRLVVLLVGSRQPACLAIPVSIPQHENDHIGPTDPRKACFLGTLTHRYEVF